MITGIVASIIVAGGITPPVDPLAEAILPGAPPSMVSLTWVVATLVLDQSFAMVELDTL